MITYLKQLSYRQLLILSALCSLLFSFLELLPHSPLNADGMWYAYVAHIYAASGWSAAMAVYPWPFLSAFAVMLSHSTGLSIFHAFYILTLFPQMLIPVAFVMLVKTLGGNTQCQRWAAIVILIYPYLNSIRMTITRDFGYWAFALFSLLFFIRFLQSSRWRDAFYFGFFMLIASLFRIEGFLFLALMPFVILIQSTQKLRDYFLANIFLLLGLIVGAGLWLTHPSLLHTSRLEEMQQQFTQVIPHMLSQLHADASKIRSAILNEVSSGNEMIILVGGLTTLFCFVIISTFKPLYFILAIYGQCKKTIANTHGEVYVLMWFIVMNLVMIAAFILERYFCAPRYPMMMILVWMLWVPFALQRLQSHTFFPVILFLLFLMAIGGLIRFGYSKHYLTEAGEWIFTHTPASAKIYTNSREIRFYGSDHYDDVQRTDHIIQIDQYAVKPWQPCQYDWIVLRQSHGEILDPTSTQWIQKHSPVEIFSNKRQDRILIYQTKDFCA